MLSGRRMRLVGRRRMRARVPGMIAVHGARVNAADVGQRGDEPHTPNGDEDAIPEWTLHA